MEISASDLETIKGMLRTWLKTSDIELEATFGAGGRVSVETFLRVAKRLSYLGYEAEVQPDKLNILLRDNMRISLENMGVVQEYCRDNRAFGKELTAMKKDSAPGVIITTKLDEYDVMIKTRRELPLTYDETRIEQCSRELQKAFQEWDSQKKSFRLLKRWSYMKDGVRFDMSMVRSNKRDEMGHYRWVRSFQEEDIMRNEPTYEIEVELDRAYFNAQEKPEEAALKAFSVAIGHVLRGIQNNTRLIKKSTVGSVRRTYESMVGTKLFRGVKPFVLSVGNMQSEPLEEFKGASIREDYNVTDKADGLRMHGYFDGEGFFYMLDMDMNVYRTDYRCKKLAKTLLDGEWVSQGKASEEGGPRPTLNNLYIFDVYYYKGADVSQKPFYRSEGDVEDTRYEILKKCMAALESAEERPSGPKPLLISMKSFSFAEKKVSIFQRAASILDRADTMDYDTDGLIFTSNKAPLPSDPQGIFDSQFKWKPAEENTIDFLVKFEKNDDGTEKVQTMIRKDTNKYIEYKTLRLYIAGKTDNEWKDPRSTILNKLPIPPRNEMKLHPVIFNPEDYPSTLASVCYITVEEDRETHEIYGLTVDSQEPIRDNSIVEMRYDPQQEEGWRWIPLVNRPDKTQKFDRGIIRGTMNTTQNANVVWNSIHNPVTEYMIRTGADRPSKEEQEANAHITSASRVAARYYDRTASKESLQVIDGLREFHKQFIKRQILYSVLKKRGTEMYKTLVDTSVGRATDIHNWMHSKVDFVLGVDYAGENIRTADSGAYSRYMNLLANPRTSKELMRTPMVFVIGDSSKSYVDGAAGETPEEADMLRAIFGLHPPAGALPKFVEDHAVGRLLKGCDVMTSMYALHYFFESREKFDGFLKNVDDILKVGGYFVGTCFDGDTLFRDREFMKKKIGESIIGVDGDDTLWSIVKQYKNESYLERSNPDAIFGNAIDVKFISIGEEHTEYLMNYEYLKQRLAELGIEPISESECAALGVPAASQMYRDSHELAESKGTIYVMNDAVKRFSYFNRWFIFKRRTKALPQEEEVVAATGPAMQNCRVAFKINPQSEGEDERYMDYGTLFKPAIPDAEDASVLYPSIKYFLAGMLFKRSSNKPEFAKQYFSTVGAIHRKYEDKREKEMVLKAYTNSRKEEIAAELKEKRDEITAKYEALRKKEKTLTEEKKRELATKEVAEQDALVKKYKEIVKKEKAAPRLTPARRLELEAEENAELDDVLRKFRIEKNMKKLGLTYADEDEILRERDEALRYAVEQRYALDERFKAITDRLRNENKYILYHMKKEGNDLGGVCLVDGTIVGSNKYGKALMTVAQIPF